MFSVELVSGKTDGSNVRTIDGFLVCRFAIESPESESCAISLNSNDTRDRSYFYALSNIN